MTDFHSLSPSAQRAVGMTKQQGDLAQVHPHRSVDFVFYPDLDGLGPTAVIAVRPNAMVHGAYIELTPEQLDSVVEQAADVLGLFVFEVLGPPGWPSGEPLYLNKATAEAHAAALGPGHTVVEHKVVP